MAYTLRTIAEKMRVSEITAKVRLRGIAKSATIAAVMKATEETPPNAQSPLSGVNTRTGSLKAHWATDSVTTPEERSSAFELVTVLGNNMPYASYVNDGHRMDRHFVPGLNISANGMLQYDPSGRGGITVGTRTQYVPGLFMVDAAKNEYTRVVEVKIQKLVEDYAE